MQGIGCCHGHGFQNYIFAFLTIRCLVVLLSLTQLKCIRGHMGCSLLVTDCGSTTFQAQKLLLISSISLH